MDVLFQKNVCSFFGHSEIIKTDSLTRELTSIITSLIEKCEIKTFLFGGFGQFDELCWEIVTQLKKKYKDIDRVFCLTDVKHLNPMKRPQYLSSLDYEKFVYLEPKFEHWYSRIYYRNCEMIEQSTFIIFYVKNYNNSGAYKALKYAQKHKKDLYLCK